MQKVEEQKDGSSSKTVEERTLSFPNWAAATSCSLQGVNLKRLSKLYLLLRGGGWGLGPVWAAYAALGWLNGGLDCRSNRLVPGGQGPCAHSGMPALHSNVSSTAHPLPNAAACAKFEQQQERFPTAEDADALAALAAGVCNEAGIDPAALPGDQLAAYAASEADMPAINAVVGGVVANEVIKAVGRKGEPAVNNFFLFSLADGGQGSVERMG